MKKLFPSLVLASQILLPAMATAAQPDEIRSALSERLARGHGAGRKSAGAHLSDLQRQR